MEILLIIIGVIGLVLLWDIYKQLRLLNEKMAGKMEESGNPKVSMSSLYHELKERSENPKEKL